MPYARVEDRRARVRARYRERLDEYRTKARQRYAERIQDPAFLENRRAQDIRRDRKRRAWTDAYKIEQGCADCGYNGDPIALDFDHVRGEKLFTISKTNRSWKALLDEVKKCDVVCANCHRIRTRDRLQS